jgi:hypothetical protein
MTLQHQSKTQAIRPVSLFKRMFQGAVIALVMISMFLAGAGEPNPEWPKLWMIKPLVIVPVAGAMGGVFYYFMDHLRHQGGWGKTLGIILSLVGYIIVVCLGVVLGLNGIMWD